MLLDNDSNNNSQNKGGWMAFYNTALNGDKHRVMALLESSADINVHGDVETTLHRVVFHGEIDTASPLLIGTYTRSSNIALFHKLTYVYQTNTSYHPLKQEKRERGEIRHTCIHQYFARLYSLPALDNTLPSIVHHSLSEYLHHLLSTP